MSLEYSHITIHIRTSQDARMAEEELRNAIRSRGYVISTLIVESEEDYNGWADK